MPEQRQEVSSAARRRLHPEPRQKLSSLGAALTRLLLHPPEPCYGNHGEQRPLAWNLYRCATCSARREPERWWHKLGWKLSAGRFDPFGRSARGRRPW